MTTTSNSVQQQISKDMLQSVIITMLQDENNKKILVSYLTDGLKTFVSDKTQTQNLLTNLIIPSIQEIFKQGTPMFKEVMSEYEKEIGMIINISRILLILNLVFLYMKVLFFIYKRFQ